MIVPRMDTQAREGAAAEVFHCAVDLPIAAVPSGVQAVRSAVRGCLVALLRGVGDAHALPMVVAELLENAVRHGDWSRRGRIEVRIEASASGSRVEVGNPVVPDGEGVRGLRRALDALARHSSPVAAYCAQVHRMSIGPGDPCELGLARIAYEGDCDVQAALEPPDRLRVSATTRARAGVPAFCSARPAGPGGSPWVHLRIPNAWQNSELVRVSVGLLAQAALGPGDHAHCLGMASGELLENAFKYGDPSAVEYTLCRVPGALQIEVRQRPSDRAACDRLAALIEWIASFGDLRAAYQSRMQQLSGGGEPGGLGLVRIAYEGGCRLGCALDEAGRVCVRAQYPIGGSEEA